MPVAGFLPAAFLAAAGGAPSATALDVPDGVVAVRAQLPLAAQSIEIALLRVRERADTGGDLRPEELDELLRSWPVADNVRRRLPREDLFIGRKDAPEK